MKVLSPDKTALVLADGIKMPAGNSRLCATGKCKRPPRDLRPHRALHRDCVVTREIRQLAWKEPRTLGQV